MSTEPKKLFRLLHDGSVVLYLRRTQTEHVFYLRLSDIPLWARLLLRDSLMDQLCAEMKQIRKEAYEQGWRDAKAKRRKQTVFNGALP